MAFIVPMRPPLPPFVAPRDRTRITGEPEPSGTRCDPRFPDVSWDFTAQHGGGHVPEDFQWRSNPKEHQDELMGEWPHPAPRASPSS